MQFGSHQNMVPSLAITFIICAVGVLSAVKLKRLTCKDPVMNAFTGEIRIFVFDYPPVDWAFCNGSIVPSAQNAALYSILGNIYGGSTPTSFALPNLNGVAPIGAGSGPGPITRGLVGAEKVTLSSAQMGNHTHTVTLETVTLAAGECLDDVCRPDCHLLCVAPFPSDSSTQGAKLTASTVHRQPAPSPRRQSVHFLD
jgi:microcystin-dependent protein